MSKSAKGGIFCQSARNGKNCQILTCSTITEMGDHILTVLSTLIGLQGRWRPSEAVEGSLIYDTLLDQLIFGKLFSYIPHGKFTAKKSQYKAWKCGGRSPVFPKGEMPTWPAAQSGLMRTWLRHFFASQPEMAKIVWFWHVAPLRKWKIISWLFWVLWLASEAVGGRQRPLKGAWFLENYCRTSLMVIFTPKKSR